MNRELVLAFRRWCWTRSNAVYHGGGKLGALRRLTAELPWFYL